MSDNATWKFEKGEGKGKDRVVTQEWTITECPTKWEMLEWGIEAGILTLSDLAVASRSKLKTGSTMTWEQNKQAMTAEVKRVDAQTLAMAKAIQTGDISSLTPEQCAKLAAALSAKK